MRLLIIEDEKRVASFMTGAVLWKRVTQWIARATAGKDRRWRSRVNTMS
jgi:hypothetical protein